MAVKVTVRNGEKRLLPTVEEVGTKVDDVVNYSRASHEAKIANDITYGHVRLNSEDSPLPAAVTPDPGHSGKAADAAHVHRLPTLAELSAAPSSHMTVEATPEVLGHIRLVSDLSSSDPLAAPQVKTVADKIAEVKNALDAQIIQLQGGIQFYGSFYFGRASLLTDLSLPKNSPRSLSVSAGLVSAEATSTDKVVTLFDFTKGAFGYYEANALDSSWGNIKKILEEGQTEPNNGTQIGVSCFFIDIEQNTDVLRLAGHANYSKKKQSWDIYPDKLSSIDGVTIKTNAQGQRIVAPYRVSDRTIDLLDFEDEVQDGVERGFHAWLDAFYRKIRGLRKSFNDLQTKTTNDKAELLETFGANASDSCVFEEQELTDADWVPEGTI